MKKDKQKENVIEDVEKDVKQSRKEQFDAILEKIKKFSDAIELHDSVKDALSKEEVDYTYLRYIESSLEEKLFNGADTKGIMPKVLLEVICPELAKITRFNKSKLDIKNIGSHFEQQENYIDKICTYDNELISVFGISEMHPNKVIKYDLRKFIRVDMIKAIQEKYKEEEKITLYQYDEYYVVCEEERIKVFSPRKMTALVKTEETIFDKIKSKLSTLFGKKKDYPELELVYDSNPNRLSNFKHTSKVDAKKRMKALLSKERELTKDEI